jgi:lauroyl/myristoyl acyltransferase
MISYIAYRVFGWLAPTIPPRLGYGLFARIGDLFYRLDSRSRRVVEANLRHVLGPDTPPAVMADKVRTVFQMQAYNYFDLFRLPAMSRDEIEARTIVHNWEYLQQALDEGKGVIVVSAHFGNVDVLLQIIGLRGIKSTLLVERLQPERLFEYVARIRGRFTGTLVPIGGSLKPVFQALRRGEVVPLVLDRDVTGSGVAVEFFGDTGMLPDGYAKLSRHTGAPIVMAFGLRLPDHHLAVRLTPPLAPTRTGDRVADVQAIMRQVLDVAEYYIAQHPEQWTLFRPIW